MVIGVNIGIGYYIVVVFVDCGVYVVLVVCNFEKGNVVWVCIMVVCLGVYVML